jgi:cholesterol oxidase
MDYDAIIIGSGFGGAVTACRLAESGLRVLVLERGRRWKEYPRTLQDPWFWDVHHPERWNGWLDLRVFRNMTVAQGAGVGGGSLIYANISTEAPRSAFETGWPSEISYKELKPYYDRVARAMNVQRVPEGQWPARMRLMKEAADKIGAGDRFQPLELAVRFDPKWSYEQPDPHNYAKAKYQLNEYEKEQGTCVHCGLCDVGCPVKAKNTLDLNYLARAEQCQAEVRELHLVTDIEPLIGGYRVRCDRLVDGERKPDALTAQLVIVAAGSLGSTELLLRCKQRTRSLPRLGERLGKRWSSNGDFLTPSVHATRKLSPTVGPTITSAINFLDGIDGGQSYWVQDGGFFDLLGPLLLAKRTKVLARHTKIKLLDDAMRFLTGHRDPLSHVMPWFGQGVDASDGELSLRRRWAGLFGEYGLHLAWDVTASLPVMNALVGTHERLARATHGLPLVPPSWRIFHDLVTPHPLGGCGMGSSAADGVVDHRGEVFGYQNLYVADGAIVPRAIGVNPSRTIAALAERIAQQICAN